MALIGGHGLRRAQPADAQPNASTAAQLPPPDLRLELWSLFHRYGRDAVVGEVALLTAKKPGRPRLNDRERLNRQIESDARALLEGKDPQKVRSNKRIANELAAKLAEGKAEETRDSIDRRLMRYLSNNRAGEVLWKVILTGGRDAPHAAYMAALRYQVPAKYRGSETVLATAKTLATDAEARVSLYRERLGEPPEGMSLGQIEAALAAWAPPQISLADALSLDPTSPLAVLSRLAENPPET